MRFFDNTNCERITGVVLWKKSKEYTHRKVKQMGPQLLFSDELHGEKYRNEGEDFREAMNRIAFALKGSDDHFKIFRQILLEQYFLPAGRVQLASGSSRKVTSSNCFVSGIIEDSFVDGPGSIMQRATEAATTMRMGGGIGYDFSRLRPRGAQIKKLGSQSSGPVSFMDIYDAICKCIASSGHRRGAQMGILRVDHPDIEEFIHSKQNEDRLRGFNISIAITDEFMEAVKDDKTFALKFNGEMYKEISATTLWETIMRSAHDWAEPGVFFIDRVNEMNNLYYCETLETCNPCGEQPLPPFGACLLGSFNLVKYIYLKSGKFVFDYPQFKKDIPYVVEAMDNIIDTSLYPLKEQEEEAKKKRRMGLGVTGLANAVEAMGHSYGSGDFLIVEKKIMKTLACESYKASALLAKEKGSFPLFDKEKYLKGNFIKKLPKDVRDMISKHGIRNSHLTSIAPTGTISLCADNVSSGLEPVFAYSFDRRLEKFTGAVVETIEDYAKRVFGVKGKRSKDVTIDEHLMVLLTAQEFVDSAISKTCNVPTDIKWEDFKQVYMTAWAGGAKGCTTYRTGGKRKAILVEKKEEDYSCELVNGQKECS